MKHENTDTLKVEHIRSAAIASAETTLHCLLTLEADKTAENWNQRTYYQGMLHTLHDLLINVDGAKYATAISTRNICPECRCLIITTTCPCKGGERV